MSTRTRTVTWHDPAEAAALVGGLSGLEILHRIASGLVPPPPAAELIGFRPTYVMPGRVVFEYVPREEHYNGLGGVHGGILTTVLDTVMGCAVQSQLPDGAGLATIELKSSFVRPVKLSTGTLRAEGLVVHGGSRVASAEAKLVAGDGTLHAHATSSWLILPAERKEAPPLAA